MRCMPRLRDLSSDHTIFVGVQVFEGSWSDRCSDLHVDLVHARSSWNWQSTSTVVLCTSMYYIIQWGNFSNYTFTSLACIHSLRMWVKNIGSVPFQTACSCTVGAWTRLPTVKQEASFWIILRNSEFCANKIRIVLFGGEQNCFRMKASSHLLLWFFCLVHSVLWCNIPGIASNRNSIPSDLFGNFHHAPHSCQSSFQTTGCHMVSLCLHTASKQRLSYKPGSNWRQQLPVVRWCLPNELVPVRWKVFWSLTMESPPLAGELQPFAMTSPSHVTSYDYTNCCVPRRVGDELAFVTKSLNSCKRLHWTENVEKWSTTGRASFEMTPSLLASASKKVEVITDWTCVHTCWDMDILWLHHVGRSFFSGQASVGGGLSINLRAMIESVLEAWVRLK